MTAVLTWNLNLSSSLVLEGAGGRRSQDLLIAIDPSWLAEHWLPITSACSLIDDFNLKKKTSKCL